MRRRGFTLVELLVAVAIILVLMTLASVAASAARTSARETTTRALIERLSNVLMQHFSTFDHRVVPGSVDSSARAAYLRNLASAELPDSWEDVRLIATGTGATGLPLTPVQRAYRGLWNSLTAIQKDSTPSNMRYVGRFNGDAECLFMMVMQGGIADCVSCGGLSQAQIGDTDTDKDGNPVPDGAPEFLDAWGQPIRYVLWPAKLELPAKSGDLFFSVTAPFSANAPAAARGGTMRPLIFSCGPDKQGSTAVNDGNNLNPSNPGNCGNPTLINFGGSAGQTDYRADNITNFDAEARR